MTHRHPDTPARCHVCGLTQADFHPTEYHERQTSSGVVIQATTPFVILTKTADGKYICKKCK